MRWFALVVAMLGQASQSVPAKPLAFEVATIKVNTSGDRTYGAQYLPGGRFVARNMPLGFLILDAYDIAGSRVVLGDPSKLDPEKAMSLRFDIEAIAENGAIPPGSSDKVLRQKLRLMLQGLLVERFKLVAHLETRERPVYAMTIAKGGRKFQAASIAETDCAERPTSPSDPNACHVFAGGGAGSGIQGQAVAVSDLARTLSDFSDRPVLDKTGLVGLFKIQTVAWLPMGMSPRAEGANDSRVTMDEMLDMLGLKLESQTAPIDVLVIEHFERPSGEYSARR